MKSLPVICCAPGSAPLGVEERGQLAACFKALADPSRVAILSMLSCEDEVCVCVLTDQLDLSQPTISHHLRILREAGLVEASRRGTWAYYRLVPAALEALRTALAPDRALATA
jgi:ArsR family transcriptional regulator